MRHSNQLKNKFSPSLISQFLAAASPWLCLAAAQHAAAFTFQAEGVDPSLLRVTVFAEGLNFPVGMTELADGSVLVATTNGSNYFNGTSGSLIRLADTDGDGVADQQSTLVNNVPNGKVTALERAGDLIAVTGQGVGAPITLYRVGASPADPLTLAGRLDLTYPSGGWLHPHSSLALRQTPGTSDQYELYFQLGSDTNFAETTRTVNLGGTLGISGPLAGDAIHRIELTDGPGGLTATGRTQIATGLRNATGIEFDPATGDLYLGDNGIDGVVDANEPTSSDEIDVVAVAQIGEQIVDFGFPDTYVQYRTDVTIGTTGVAPLVAFQPVPAPNGDETEGVNEIAFAPPLFPAGLAHGLFAGFHGKFGSGGVANEENPLVFVDLTDGSYEHVVTVDQADVGHLDGLLSTTRTLYVSDLAPLGGFSGRSANSGKIYSITSLIPDGDYDRDGHVEGYDFLEWQEEYGSSQASFAGADGNGDGIVDAGDLVIWEGGYGAPSSASALLQTQIPEPCATMLFVLGVTLLSRRRR